MADSDVLESTEIPEFVEEPNAEDEDDMMEAIPTDDEQFAVRSLFVRIADRCLSHAHAKEQAALPSADDKSMEDGAPSASDANPIVLKKKGFPRINAFVVGSSHPFSLFLMLLFFGFRAIQGAKEMLEALSSDKHFIVDSLLQWLVD